MASLELSDFQKRKIMSVFNTLYDTNKDGVIEKSDFEEAINKICHIHGWPKGGEKYQEAQQTLSLIWEGLKGIADENKDDMVTKDEWVQMWSSCVRDVSSGEGFPHWQKKYMDFMFRVNDTSGDNYIDKKEYTTIYTSFGIDKEECESAFDHLADGTDGRISREDFENLWREYFVSDDISARGNYLFGRPPF
ncbi:calexcitin-2-like [Haliotis rubra]|uniref:calexcitin-2-like n=1 Tax=Haliotis rubra TaxID=36100 RepID=UPI001EE5D25C|nr:calexcitin-2-like [Haliotis rubra]